MSLGSSAMRTLTVFLAVATVGSGCTTASLNRHSLGQNGSFVDLHYRVVLENLALLARSPSALPSYSIIDFGTSTVTDQLGLTGGVSLTTSPAVANLDPAVQRTIAQNWTLHPITAPEKLRALSLAFHYALSRGDSPLHYADVSLDQYSACQPSLA